MANEKRLIWDEDAKRRIIALAVGHHTDTLPVDMIINAILRQAPTVDAVEVVRCKDCKDWGQDVNSYTGEDESFCMNPDGLDNYAHPDDFCSYGERKDNE